MKKGILYLLAVIILVAGLLAWLIMGTATHFTSRSKYLYIYEGRDAKEQILKELNDNDYIRNVGLFSLVSDRLHVWEKLKPGRFEISKGQSILGLVRTLRNNHQSAVKLVINKIRTNEDLARLIGKNFISDSAQTMQFFQNADSLRFVGVDSNTLMTLIIPNTYVFNWNTPVKKILLRLQTEKDNFWEKNDRTKKAENLGLSPVQVYTLASIVEEETNDNKEKGNIASVYMNRLAKGMYLGADPTIKFALKDFSLKRILFVHLAVNSPYNTYRNKGLPPGPICTPSAVTIDAVLDAPKTDYLFFVASSDFNGSHHFSSNYAEHMQYAKAYQQALDEKMKEKSAQ